MNRDQSLDLAALINVVAPWVDGLYAFPVRPSEQRFPDGPYLISMGSGFLRLHLYEPEDLADVLRQLDPPTGPSGLPLLDQQVFDDWVIEQLTRTDLEESEQRCGTGELEIYCHDPDNNATRLLVSSRVRLAPVVEGGIIEKNEVPTAPEVILTVAWSCPVCQMPLTLTKRMHLVSEYRLFAGPIHQATGIEKRCPASVWVEVGYCEQDDPQFDPLEAKVWHLVRRHQMLPVVNEDRIRE